MSNMARDWDNVIFTDSKIWAYQSAGNGLQGKQWCDAASVPVTHTARNKQQVHAYAGICARGHTELIFVTGTSLHRG